MHAFNINLLAFSWVLSCVGHLKVKEEKKNEGEWKSLRWAREGGGRRVGAGGGSDWPEYFHLHRHSCWPGKMHQHHHHSWNQQIAAILATTSSASTSASQFSSSAASVSPSNLPRPPHQKMQLQKIRPNNDLKWHFWATFRYEDWRACFTYFPTIWCPPMKEKKYCVKTFL